MAKPRDLPRFACGKGRFGCIRQITPRLGFHKLVQTAVPKPSLSRGSSEKLEGRELGEQRGAAERRSLLQPPRDERWDSGSVFLQ